MENKVFNPEKKFVLESPERYKSLPPFATLESLNLKEDDIIIDVGCGTGYFTLPAAQITGPNGRVIGIDISEEMLQEVKGKIIDKNINIELMISDSIRLPLDDSFATFALLSDVLHETDKMPEMLKEVYRVLKPGARLAILEWEKREMPKGPPLEHRLHQKEIMSLVDEAGYTMAETSPIGSFHICCTAIRK